MNWQEHVAIVTGAGSGIGQAIAARFAQAGAQVVVADIHPGRGQAVVSDLLERYQRGIFFHLNVARSNECEALIRFTLDNYGRLDTLVNNAGVNFVKPTLEMDESDWDRVLDVDLKGTFLCSRFALPHMVQQQSGCIINIASVHTLATLPEAAPYAAAKAGMIGLTKALAVEFAPYGIRVNAVSPGLTATQIWQDILDAAEDPDQARQHWSDNIPAGRVQEPEEVANVVLFLASDQATYLTGDNLVTDGGMTSQLVSRARYASKALEGRLADE